MSLKLQKTTFFLVAIYALWACDEVQKKAPDAPKTPEKYDGVLVPFRSGDLWGYSDTLGNSIITPNYEYADFEQLGLYRVCKGSKWFLIDREGVTQSKEFDELGKFFGERAKVREGDLYGFLNKEGDIAIPVKYTAVADFSENTEAVRVFDDNKNTYIDKSGHEIVPLHDDDNYPFYAQERVVRGNFKVEWDGEIGWMNIKNDTLVSPQYEDATLVAHGACVMKDLKYVLVDLSGDTLSDTSFDQLIGVTGIEPQSDVFIARNGSQWGIVDVEGNVLVPFDYEVISPASSGFFYFKKAGKWGLMTLSEVLLLGYDFIDQLNDGLCAVKVKDRWGMVSTQQKSILDTKYDNISDVYQDFVRVKSEGNWLVVNYKTGNVFSEY